MTTPDIRAEVPATGGWRFKLGIAIFILAFALWLVLPLAGSMGASAGRIAALTGANAAGPVCSPTSRRAGSASAGTSA